MFSNYHFSFQNSLICLLLYIKFENHFIFKIFTQLSVMDEDLLYIRSIKPQHMDGILSSLEKACTITCCGIVKLYLSNHTRKFNYSNLSGGLCFVINRQNSTKLLQLIDLNTYKTTFEIELYIKFSETYKKPSEVFHYFPISKGWVGFQFANSSEANEFYNNIIKFDVQESVEDFCNSLESYRENIRVAPKFAKETFMIRRGFFKGIGLKERNFENMLGYNVGKPYGFERTSASGWDPVRQRFNLDEMPKELKDMLKTAGIPKKDLKNKNVSLLIFEILMNPNQLDSVLNKFLQEGKKNQSSPKKKRGKPKVEEKRHDKSIDLGEEEKELHEGVGSLNPHVLNALGTKFGDKSRGPSVGGRGISVAGGVGMSVRGGSSIPVPPPLLNLNAPAAPPLPGGGMVPYKKPSTVVGPRKESETPSVKGFAEQLKGVKLKQVDREREKEREKEKGTNMFKNAIEGRQKIKIEGALHAAIVERRAQLLKNEDDSDSDQDRQSDSSWGSD